MFTIDYIEGNSLVDYKGAASSDRTRNSARYLATNFDVIPHFVAGFTSVDQHYRDHGSAEGRTAPAEIVPAGCLDATHIGLERGISGEVVLIRSAAGPGETSITMRYWVDCANAAAAHQITLYGAPTGVEIVQHVVPLDHRIMLFAEARLTVAIADDCAAVGVSVTDDRGEVLASWKGARGFYGAASIESIGGDAFVARGWFSGNGPEDFFVQLQAGDYQLPLAAVCDAKLQSGPTSPSIARNYFQWLCDVDLSALPRGDYQLWLKAWRQDDCAAREWGPFNASLLPEPGPLPHQSQLHTNARAVVNLATLASDPKTAAAWGAAAGNACFGTYVDVRRLLSDWEAAVHRGRLVVAVPLTKEPPAPDELIDAIASFVDDLSVPAAMAANSGAAAGSMLLMSHEALASMWRDVGDYPPAADRSSLLQWLSQAQLKVQVPVRPLILDLESVAVGDDPKSYLKVRGWVAAHTGSIPAVELIGPDGPLPVTYMRRYRRPHVVPRHGDHGDGACHGFELGVRWRDLDRHVIRPRLRAAEGQVETEIDIGVIEVAPILFTIERATAFRDAKQTRIRILGWAGSRDRSPVRMAVTDGKSTLRLAVQRHHRADVAAYLDDVDDDYCGFQAEGTVGDIDLDHLRLLMQCASGHCETALSNIACVTDEVLYHVNEARWTGSDRRLVVSGWAAAQLRDVEWVGLVHGSCVVGRGPAAASVTSGERPPAFVPVDRYCGFRLVADFADQPVGSLYLVAKVGDEVRTLTTLEVSSPAAANDLEDNSTIRVAWDEPADGSAVSEDQYVRLLGWAFSIDGDDVVVEAHCGDRLLARAKPSFPRPDVLNAYAIRSESVRPGFVLTTDLRLQPQETAAIRLTCRSANGREVDLGTRTVVGRAVGLMSGPRWAKWLMANALSEKSRADAQAAIATWCRRPTISILMPHYNPQPEWLDRAVESVARQWYDEFELCIADDGSTDPDCVEYLRMLAARHAWIRVRFCDVNRGIAAATNTAAELAAGEYVLLLDQDDELSANCLFEFVKHINEHGDSDIIYSDSDKIDTRGRRYDPHFKPDYSPDLLYSYMYLNQALLIRRELFDAIGGFRLGFDGSQDHDLTFRLVENAKSIAHVPAILYHWRAHSGSTAVSGNEKPRSFDAGMAAVRDALSRRGLPFAAVERPQFAANSGLGCYRVRWNVQGSPLVSIIIPSRDRRELVEQCIGSIAARTTYPNYEIIVVDDRSDDPATLAYFGERGHKVVRVEDRGQGFNFSALVNKGAQTAEGEYLLVLNNDTEVLTPEWLEELLGWAQQPGVGVVGPRLLYPGGALVQHAGVTLGLEERLPGHLFRGEPAHAGGYCSWALLARNVSAVTFAAAMIPRPVFDILGGLNEDDFPVAYQDPDFCLRAARAGYRTVYTPFADLIHHESLSKRADFTDLADQQMFRLRWPMRDPYFNPNLHGVGDLPAVVDRRVLLTHPHAIVRIAALAHNLKRQGAPISQLLTLRGLVERHGFELHLLTSGDGPLLDAYQAFATSISSIDSGDASQWRAETTAWLDRVAPDLVYGNTLEACRFIDLALERGDATFWNIRESADPNVFFSDWPEARAQAIRCIAGAGRLGFVARSTLDLFRGSLRTLAPTVVIPNGVDLQRFRPRPSTAPRAWNPAGAEDAILIGTVGTVCPRKAPHLAIRAFIRLQIERPDQPLWFLSIGEIPTSLSEYADLVRNVMAASPHPERILMLPESENIVHWYQTLDIFVLTSLEESFPRVVIEAMACGLPVVAANTFGVAEQVIDGRTGRKVEPGDIDGTVAALAELIDDAARRHEMGRQGRLVAEAMFSLDQMVDCYAREFRLLREEHG
jgi:GT2 family glycosyltransferase/glycosyltransferase involved in cell wall biosynthesis